MAQNRGNDILRLFLMCLEEGDFKKLISLRGMQMDYLGQVRICLVEWGSRVQPSRLTTN